MIHFSWTVILKNGGNEGKSFIRSRTISINQLHLFIMKMFVNSVDLRHANNFTGSTLFTGIFLIQDQIPIFGLPFRLSPQYEWSIFFSLYSSKSYPYF